MFFCLWILWVCLIFCWKESLNKCLTKGFVGGLMPTNADFQLKRCLNCGSVWRISRYTGKAWIEAELLTCPLCSEKE